MEKIPSKKPLYQIPVNLDREWVILMLAAKKMKLSPDEVRQFLRKQHSVQIK
ncbi:anti-repressor SinI family protein [Bacillus horti]|uniref:Sin domain-containing protein n=1 Tax=Caldalkalibacillus horti TaxID=77523 RepID=A0ABT9W4I3_9BACI|nr:anti-repressor SinI family protein [Bacillus horti]MDQ0167987.1 hypothetical protein [Bacillus horti]